MRNKKEIQGPIVCQLCGQKTVLVAPLDKMFGKGGKKVLIEKYPCYSLLELS